MRVAIKWAQIKIDDEGSIAGHESGDTLVRRLLRIFPDAVIVGSVAKSCNGFEVLPLEDLNVADDVIINMDVVDSPMVYETLAQDGKNPRIMNFMWWAIGNSNSDVRLASVALSCALFPTFANSERTATEVKEIVGKWAAQRFVEQMKVNWVNLGFRLAHVQKREPTATPTVLYPAIYLSNVKRPNLFLEITEAVHKHYPMKVEMRLHDKHLVSEKAMNFSRRDWIWVGPLTATRNSYWHALARTTAFVATAEDESYGIQYVEALGAGVVGIFPNLSWARALVPEGYPFLYKDAAEAKEMLTYAITKPEECLEKMNSCAGTSLQQWIAQHHSDDAFDRAIINSVQQWFGE